MRTRIRRTSSLLAALALAASLIVAVASPASADVPAAPTAVVGTAGASSITVTWTAPAGTVDGYIVSALNVATVDPMLPEPGFSKYTTGTSAEFDELTPGGTYMFKVQAYNADGIGLPAESTVNVVMPAVTAPPRLARIVRQGGGSSLYKVVVSDLDGSDPVEVGTTNLNGADLLPPFQNPTYTRPLLQWSPDGNRLLWFERVAGNTPVNGYDIVIADLTDPENPVVRHAGLTVSGNPEGYITGDDTIFWGNDDLPQVTWARDSQRVAFVSRLPDGTDSVFVMNTTVTNPSLTLIKLADITNPDIGNLNLASSPGSIDWNPAADWIAVAASATGQVEIVDAQTGGRQPLAGVTGSHVRWTADGGSLIVVNTIFRTTISRVDIATMQVTQLVDLADQPRFCDLALSDTGTIVYSTTPPVFTPGFSADSMCSELWSLPIGGGTPADLTIPDGVGTAPGPVFDPNPDSWHYHNIDVSSDGAHIVGSGCSGVNVAQVGNSVCSWSALHIDADGSDPGFTNVGDTLGYLGDGVWRAALQPDPAATPAALVVQASPGVAAPDDVVSVTASGFDGDATYDVAFDGATVSTGQDTPANGTIVDSVTIPTATAPGVYDIELRGTSADTGFPRTAKASVLVVTTDAGKFVPVTPERIWDSRNATAEQQAAPGPKGFIAAEQTVNVAIGGQGAVPGTATAVVLNLTATQSASGGFITAWPTGETQPGVSSLNLTSADQTRPNLVVVPLGTGGQVSFFAKNGAHLVADVFGYFEPAVNGSDLTNADGRFVPLSPTRLWDSRQFADTDPLGTLAADESATLQVTGAGGIPASGVSAVALTVTGANAPANGFITVYPTGASRPVAANLNLQAGVTAPNMVIVPVGTGGQVDFYSLNGADLIVDVTGYFTGAGALDSASGYFYPVTPERLWDSREVATPPTGHLDAGDTVTVDLAARTVTSAIPASASAVSVNLAGVKADSAGFGTVYPAGQGRPVAASFLLGATNDTRSIAAIPTVAVTQNVHVYSHGGADVVIDANGYFISSRPPLAVS
ncbi:MAG: fibronectin type III domain-containing protein [Acidimicrobiales bacterium]|nr:fibronectin type III domain-containing protein [Acidimicrobiales bacterium]